MATFDNAVLRRKARNDVAEIDLVGATNTWSFRTCQGKLRSSTRRKGVLSIPS
jgi:hypothetical protein